MSERPLPPPDLDLGGRRVLLVDDVSVSGATPRFAAGLPKDAAHVSTRTLRGKAEIVLLPGERPGVNWPWSLP